MFHELTFLTIPFLNQALELSQFLDSLIVITLTNDRLLFLVIAQCFLFQKTYLFLFIIFTLPFKVKLFLQIHQALHDSLVAEALKFTSEFLSFVGDVSIIPLIQNHFLFWCTVDLRFIQLLTFIYFLIIPFLFLRPLFIISQVSIKLLNAYLLLIVLKYLLTFITSLLHAISFLLLL